MIEMNILQERYSCRTKDLLWFKEMRLAVELIVKEKKTLSDIKRLSEQMNLYNAASSSRANEIRIVIARRINRVRILFPSDDGCAKVINNHNDNAYGPHVPGIYE